MSDAPERIYIPDLPWQGESEYALATKEAKYQSGSPSCVEYVRADLYQSQAERIAELEAEVKSIRQARANFLEASADRPQVGD